MEDQRESLHRMGDFGLPFSLSLLLLYPPFYGGIRPRLYTLAQAISSHPPYLLGFSQVFAVLLVFQKEKRMEGVLCVIPQVIKLYE